MIENFPPDIIFQIADIARYTQPRSYFYFSSGVSIKRTSTILHENVWHYRLLFSDIALCFVFSQNSWAQYSLLFSYNILALHLTIEGFFFSQLFFRPRIHHFFLLYVSLVSSLPALE